MIRYLSAAVLTALSVSSLADEATEALIKEALKAPIRTEADTDRDRNRRPAQTLAFFGMTKDMKVLELLPGGGWYTKILAPTLAEDGELYVSIGAGRVKDNLLDKDGFDRVRLLDIDPGFERSDNFGLYNLTNDVDFGETGFDMVLTFRNAHNLNPASRAKMNNAAFKALKSGGVYGVVDHTARHMEPLTAENRRRLDPVVMIKEALAAGFVFEDFSDIHYRADDELRFEVGRKSVTGNSDRFTLKFRKP
ncbi:MAG: class I SAM-dependent methyltransferase [Gammaproteobacteria bacterium]